MGRPRGAAAPAMAAGVIYQFERALYHLAHGGQRALVGIEEIDDVVVSATGKPGRNLTIEQDKHSLLLNGFQISDRSLAIWKTLQNWLNAWNTHGAEIKGFLFVTNHAVTNAFLRKLGKQNKTGKDIANLVAELRTHSGMLRGKDSEAAKVISDVCARTDEALTAVLQRIELVEPANGNADGSSILDKLHLPDGIDANQVIITLKGWVQDVSMHCWRSGKPAFISRQAFSNQVNHAVSQMRRKHVRERARRFVPVTADEQAKEKSSRFVHHLAMIEADDDVVDMAIADYLMFSKEKLRLTEEGVVNEDDWTGRSDQLCDRWKRILARLKSENKGAPAPDLGRKVLHTTTDDHKEPLAGESTDELYFTSGHYHRLANEDAVWWFPSFRPKKSGG